MKQLIREWLIEHFNFVSREDYEARGQVLHECAKYAAQLERNNRALYALTDIATSSPSPENKTPSRAISGPKPVY